MKYVFRISDDDDIIQVGEELSASDAAAVGGLLWSFLAYARQPNAHGVLAHALCDMRDECLSACPPVATPEPPGDAAVRASLLAMFDAARGHLDAVQARLDEFHNKKKHDQS